MKESDLPEINEEEFFKGQVDDKTKIEVISFIDYINNKVLKRSQFFRELKSMKARYIYKDICTHELKNDITYLKNLKEIVNE
jgi:hypothetical protein